MSWNIPSWIKGHRKVAVVAVSIVTASVAGLSVLTATPGRASTASPQTSQPGPTTAPAYPTFVQMPADQAAHPGFQNEWWYTVGHLSAAGHEYGYEVQLTATGGATIALTDVTNGTFETQQFQYSSGQFSASSTTLDVRMPDASLSGAPENMHLTANLPHGAGTLDLTLDAAGPTMYNNTTGLFPFLGGTSYYYSLPNLRTSGTLTLDGNATPVVGTSWLDRQWGNWDWTKVRKWTWMALQLSNGKTLNLWDLYDASGEHYWATVLNPDGNESVVAVEPLASTSSNFQTSSASGQRYAGAWIVQIPGQNATLTVTAKPVLQEVTAGGQAVNEADSSVIGTYQGKPVTGLAYVEQLGNWQP